MAHSGHDRKRERKEKGERREEQQNRVEKGQCRTVHGSVTFDAR
jgi:hypothetical protein